VGAMRGISLEPFWTRSRGIVQLTIRAPRQWTPSMR
jgi:hypothetical protein